jgi:hypothetical protein
MKFVLMRHGEGEMFNEQKRGFGFGALVDTAGHPGITGKREHLPGVGGKRRQGDSAVPREKKFTVHRLGATACGEEKVGGRLLKAMTGHIKYYKGERK